MRTLNGSNSNPNPEVTSPYLPKWLGLIILPIAVFIIFLFINSFRSTYPDFAEYTQTKPDFQFYYDKAQALALQYDEENLFEKAVIYFYRGKLEIKEVEFQYGKHHSVKKIIVVCRNRSCLETEALDTMYSHDSPNFTQKELENNFLQVDRIVEVAYSWMEEIKISGFTTIDHITFWYYSKTWVVDFQNNIYRDIIYISINSTSMEVVKDSFNK